MGREFKFTTHDFERLRKLVNEHTGISLSDHKQEMLYSRLSRRLRALEIDTFSHYYKLLQSGDSEELVHFINAVTTNLTAFFREPHHFTFLRETLFPQLLIKKQESQRVRIWSAGCASGEEAYSLAMVAKEFFPPYWDVKILATDLDSNVINLGKKGVYEAGRVKHLPDHYLHRWFKRGTGKHEGFVQISPELQNMVAFKKLNLMHIWPMKGTFDIIFCRNVVIYFSKPTQRILFDRFANSLDNEGYLFIGHSESLFQLTKRFSLLRQTIYVKER